MVVKKTVVEQNKKSTVCVMINRNVARRHECPFTCKYCSAGGSVARELPNCRYMLPVYLNDLIVLSVYCLYVLLV